MAKKKEEKKEESKDVKKTDKNELLIVGDLIKNMKNWEKAAFREFTKLKDIDEILKTDFDKHLVNFRLRIGQGA